MTAPAKALVFPAVDHEAIEQAIDIQKRATAAADIKTRSQIMLEDFMQREVDLNEQGAHMREQIMRAKSNLQKLQNLIKEMETAEQDNAIELSVVLQAINALKQAGVAL